MSLDHVEIHLSGERLWYWHPWHTQMAIFGAKRGYSAKVSWLCGPAARQWSVAPFVERRNGRWLEWIERIISSPSIESKYYTVCNKRYWNLQIFKIQHSVYLLVTVNLAHVTYIKMHDTDWYTDKIPVTCRLETTAGFPSWSRHLQSLRLHTCLPCQVHWPVPGLQQWGGWTLDGP